MSNKNGSDILKKRMKFKCQYFGKDINEKYLWSVCREEKGYL